MIADLEQLIETTDERKLYIRSVEKKILEMVKPLVFQGAKSFEIAIDKNFKSLCLTLGEHTNREVEKMPVKDYYILYDLVKEKYKPNKDG